ncbi:MAG: phosphocholine cytidylyltransferase family protein [Opitutaceae bacterium]|nr:phosphocholine cytidylyltransferase family protein [Opitutaceae bacterium]
MKVIILSAGQGKRLYPHTIDRPKCLVPIAENCTILGWQLRQLEAAGIRDVVIVTGFQAKEVEEEIRRHGGAMTIRTLFNPAHATADNLTSAALAAPEMDQDFIILNGDTLFTASVPAGLCAAPFAPVTMVVAWKDRFDEDDMKAIVENGRLKAVAKTLDARAANAESIGMILFRAEGVAQFRQALATAGQASDSARKFYLSAIDILARQHPVAVHPVAQDDWSEVDVPADLEHARSCIERWRQPGGAGETART